ncbi:hypothetical protein [Streptomyces sp. NPDC096033]|uniref:hypothetical protein n=1 Tax=Streptomyces sp. NPDC096033 TaxID=3366071 RepID=UPI00382C2A2B
MTGKRITNPAGLTNNYRRDVLRALGVLKVATADQIQRIGAPHLTFRHAAKETPSKQKQARTASRTSALSDMRGHGLPENGGGIDTIASYWTEAPLPATGTWNAPRKGGVQAHLVLTAPQDGVPLLFIEVDNCHETAEELAAKPEKLNLSAGARSKSPDHRCAGTATSGTRLTGRKPGRAHRSSPEGCL